VTSTKLLTYFDERFPLSQTIKKPKNALKQPFSFKENMGS